MAEQHIVIKQQIVGSLSSYEWVYSWDGARFPSRSQAISHGFETYGHDDFNVGVVKNDRLTWFGWMDDELDREILPQIAEKIGLRS